ARLAASPTDAEATVGIARVDLVRRTRGVDAPVVREQAAAVPTEVGTALLVADLDVLGGHVEDAFARLVELVRVTSGAERNLVRTRLVELFDVVGPDDPRVAKARLALANALF
ncbi:MAG: tetratricopeptide repeat protein, partial [Actinomycetes bacterium]